MESKPPLWTNNFIIACLANFLMACAFFLFMPTIPIYLTEKLHVPASDIGIALSSYALALLLIRPFGGYWVDVYQRKPIFLLGISLFVITFLGYFFATSLLFFVALRFVHGLFWGLSTVSSNTVAIDIIPATRRAEGIGFFGVTMNIAMAIAPFIAVGIYEDYGFQFLIISALAMGVLAIIAVTSIRIPKRQKLDRIPPISWDRFILIKAIPVFINQLFVAFGWGTLVAFAVLYGKKLGIENSGLFFLFLAAGIVLSRITSGRLVDRGHLHNIMAIAMLVIAVGFFSFAIAQEIYLYCSSAFALGLGYGTLFPALQTIYINMAPSSKRGTANSTYLTGFDLGIGIGMLVGAYLGGHFGYDRMYEFTAILTLIALGFYFLISRKVYEKNKIPNT